MTVTAAGILYKCGPEVLLIRRTMHSDEPGTWGIPGGKLEPNEIPELAAMRESFEEVGYIPRKPITPFDLDVHNGVEFQTFLCELDCRFDPVLNDEHSQFAWIPIMSLPRDTHPGVKKTIRKAGGNAVDASGSNSVTVTWLDRDYKQKSKKFKSDVNAPPEAAWKKANEFARSLEDSSNKSKYGTVRSVKVTWDSAEFTADHFERIYSGKGEDSVTPDIVARELEKHRGKMQDAYYRVVHKLMMEGKLDEAMERINRVKNSGQKPVNEAYKSKIRQETFNRSHPLPKGEAFDSTYFDKAYNG